MSSNGKPTPQPPAAPGNGAGGPPKMYTSGPPTGRSRGPPSAAARPPRRPLLPLQLLLLLLLLGGPRHSPPRLPRRRRGRRLLPPLPPAPPGVYALRRARHQAQPLVVRHRARAHRRHRRDDVTLTAKNPNKKLVYFYDDFTVTAATAANAVLLGEASVPGFAHDAGNITVIQATVSGSALGVDPAAASSDIKKSGEFAITVDLETKAGVRVGGLKTKKIGIQVHCDGVKVSAPAAPPAQAKKKKLAKAATAGADAPAPAAVDAPAPVAVDDAPPAAPATTVARVCEVRIRVKIWKWTF